MSNLEHLLENGLICLEKGLTNEEWRSKMANDVNWKGVERVNIDDLWEICQYIICVWGSCRKDIDQPEIAELTTEEAVYLLRNTAWLAPSLEPVDEAIEMACEALRRPRSPRYGKWIRREGYATPGGTPVYVCKYCGGTEHLYGAEFPRRKMVCDKCGSVNSYPWEKTCEEYTE